MARAGELTRALGIPSPLSLPRGKPTVAAVIASRGQGSRLEILVLLETGLSAAEQHQAQTRALAAGQVLAQRGIPVRVCVQTPESVDVCTERWLGVALWGALLVGKLPAPLLSELTSDRLASSGSGVIELAAGAPSPFMCVALMLLCGGMPRLPGLAIRAALRKGTGSGVLADPELACALWASHERALGPLLYSALALTSVSAAVRAAASGLEGPAATSPSNAAQVIALGRELGGRCARSVRRSRVPRSSPLFQRLKEEVIAPGIPVALLPALGRWLKDSDAVEIRGRRTLLERRRSGTREVWHSSGAQLGSGRELPQARIRALSLIVRALGRLPEGGLSSGKVWQLIGAKLRQSVKRRTLLAIFRSEPSTGAPADPLNRGARRRIAVRPVLTVLLRPGSRPSSRTMRPDEAIKRLLFESGRGTVCEIVGDDPGSQPLALRVGRLLRHWSQPLPSDLVAVAELGGNVLLRTATDFKQMSLSSFSQRPRRAHIDPEAPDLPTVVRPAITRVEVIDCCVLPFSATHAQVVYIDAEQVRVSEQVPLDRLEDWLQETRDLLRVLRPQAVMPVRIDPALESLAGRRSRPSEVGLRLNLGGSFPLGIWAELDGERFGGGRALGWEAAALSLLAAWPSDTQPKVTVHASTIVLCGAEASALFHLYARSVVIRRLARSFRTFGRA